MFHGALLDPSGLLVAVDRRVVERGDVDGEPVDVRRDHARPSVEPVAGSQARDGDCPCASAR